MTHVSSLMTRSKRDNWCHCEAPASWVCGSAMIMKWIHGMFLCASLEWPQRYPWMTRRLAGNHACSCGWSHGSVMTQNTAHFGVSWVWWDCNLALVCFSRLLFWAHGQCTKAVVVVVVGRPALPGARILEPIRRWCPTQLGSTTRAHPKQSP